MKLWSNSFQDGRVIPGEFAFGVMDPVSHVALSANRNPHLAWSDVPTNAKSLALICHDIDVPSRGDDVNQEGKVVPQSLPRVDFYHWVWVDLPASLTDVQPGQMSDGVTARGKSGPAASIGRQGVNDYTGWFVGDKEMGGTYFGYDGPCPPWNDAIPHRYLFTLYALDIEHVPVSGDFTGQQVLQAIQGHVLAQAQLRGIYSLNPDVVRTLPEPA